MTKVWVDPPSGWMYGFPDILDETKETYSDMLKRHKYPEKDMDLALSYSRYWKVEDDENSSNT